MAPGGGDPPIRCHGLHCPPTELCSVVYNVPSPPLAYADSVPAFGPTVDITTAGDACSPPAGAGPAMGCHGYQALPIEVCHVVYNIPSPPRAYADSVPAYGPTVAITTDGEACIPPLGAAPPMRCQGNQAPPTEFCHVVYTVPSAPRAYADNVAAYGPTVAITTVGEACIPPEGAAPPMGCHGYQAPPTEPCHVVYNIPSPPRA